MTQLPVWPNDGRPRHRHPAGAAAHLAAVVERLFEVLRRLNPRDGLSLTAASTLRRLAELVADG